MELNINLLPLIVHLPIIKIIQMKEYTTFIKKLLPSSKCKIILYNFEKLSSFLFKPELVEAC